MARREIVRYYDDLDNTELSEDEVNIVRFSLDGMDYIMELKKENADAFRSLLSPYLEVARHDFIATPRPGLRTGSTREIRQWALDQGKQVALRGKLPADIITAYHEAHL